MGPEEPKTRGSLGDVQPKSLIQRKIRSGSLETSLAGKTAFIVQQRCTCSTIGGR